MLDARSANRTMIGDRPQQRRAVASARDQSLVRVDQQHRAQARSGVAQPIGGMLDAGVVDEPIAVTQA
ncbi:MAG: hypothetical protein IAG13_14895, partial [Deltaproteobacteria bacterium]|nr:hypothetical protein [Nannocystaceae bacterium]